MAFPETGVLDSFDRANNASLGASWSGPLYTGEALFSISSNTALSASGAGGWTSGYYNAAVYGPMCEAYATITALGTYWAVYLGLANPGVASMTGYYVLTRADNTIYLYRTDSSTVDVLLDSISATLTAGDKIGISRANGLVKAYKYVSSTWSEVLSKADATYNAAGYIGMAGNGSAAFNDLSGGTTLKSGLSLMGVG